MTVSMMRSDNFWKSSLVRGWKDIKKSSSEDVPVYVFAMISWTSRKYRYAHLPVQLLQKGPQHCWDQISARVPCPAESFLEDQGQHQNRRNCRSRHQNLSPKLFGPLFQQVLPLKSLSSSAVQQAQEPQILLLKIPPNHSNMIIILQYYWLYGDRLTTGVSSSLSSPSHFDLTTAGFFKFIAGDGAVLAGAVFVGAGLMGFPFADGPSLSDSSTLIKNQKERLVNYSICRDPKVKDPPQSSDMIKL